MALQSCPLLALASPVGTHVLAQLAPTFAERTATCAARLLLNTNPAVLFSGGSFETAQALCMPDHCVHLACLASLEHTLALTVLGTTVPCFCGPPLTYASPCAPILLRQKRSPSPFDLLLFDMCTVLGVLSVLRHHSFCVAASAELFSMLLGLVALRASHLLLLRVLLTSTAALLTLLCCRHTRCSLAA